MVRTSHPEPHATLVVLNWRRATLVASALAMETSAPPPALLRIRACSLLVLVVFASRLLNFLVPLAIQAVRNPAGAMAMDNALVAESNVRHHAMAVRALTENVAEVA